ncbi:MAG TPA: YggS family pyridoxal phosphate-dependent enzyme [Arachidicoccus sp.]|nr:YggS family pyridoxal phosphate-dependent enzyme [Arachidicoccus sp.]
MNDQAAIKTQLSHIHEQIESACRQAGRPADSVRLLLATKTVEPARIRLAINAGETLIGENKVQEYQQKAADLADLSCERHFIGHLQTNKAKEVLKYVSCIQSVDRLSLAEKLNTLLKAEDRKLSIYLQVNTSFEDSKFGCNPTEVYTLMEQLQTLDALKVKGLMTIGLFSDDEKEVRKSYQLLREIREKGQQLGLLPAGQLELSMGMSNDLKWAIQEGATMVRVGSAIFGNRIYT